MGSITGGVRLLVEIAAEVGFHRLETLNAGLLVSAQSDVF